jgi:hypothetical protein
MHLYGSKTKLTGVDWPPVVRSNISCLFTKQGVVGSEVIWRDNQIFGQYENSLVHGLFPCSIKIVTCPHTERNLMDVDKI